jgi:methylmalonyl-CoA/ethylmalonyl-CoA epimerase
MENLPFKILSIEHVAIAVDDFDKPANLFGKLLGIDNSSTEKIAEQKVMTDIFNTGNGKIELVKPTSNDSPVSKYLEKKGQGLHHIALKVDDLQEALNYLDKQGVILIDKTPRKGAEGLSIAFLHPKSTSGILVELVQE